MSVFKNILGFGVLVTLFFSITACQTYSKGESTTKSNAAFSKVYEILKSHCFSCHSENGPAKDAWSMNAPAIKYSDCILSKDQSLCTTYFELTSTEWPWIVAGDPQASQPFVNACDKEQSYHIGTSIPDRLSDNECALLESWILEGAKFE